MLLMVTNRRKKGGEYIDDEKPGYSLDYLYDYRGGPQGNDGFNSKGPKGFTECLLAELNRLREAEGINTPKIGIYLHGYNNDYQDSIDELYDMHMALTGVIGYEPVLVGFSWPSSGAAADYLADREEVRESVPAFVRFLRLVYEFQQNNARNPDPAKRCFSTTFCIAHSMGNYLLRKGMEYLSDSLGSPIGMMMFSETVMLAPDIAAKDIEQDGKGQYIADFSRRVHVYYSKHDRALKASSLKRFGAKRLGRHGAEDYGNLPANVVMVNANKYANQEGIKGIKDRQGKQVSVHSSHRYQPEILKDMEQVLSSVDRDLMDTRMAVDDEEEFGYLSNHYVLI